MKHLEVVAAIIIHDNKVLATQRGYGEFKGWWEFPGGKLEKGETLEEAIRREIREELDAEINITGKLQTIEWDYPTFHLTMHCMLCSLASDTIRLKEHEAASWLTKDTLRSVKWLPADIGLLDQIQELLTAPADSKCNSGNN